MYEQAYYNRGISKSKLEDYSGAIADCTKAIELDQKDAEAFYIRGLSKLQIDNNGGCLDLNKAGELGMTKAYEVIKKNCH